MRKTILLMLSAIALMAFTSVQTARAGDTTEPWPGVTKKVLVDNEHVNISEVTFAPGAVAVWHSHPQYTVYALTDIMMKVEIKGQPDHMVDAKAGQAMYSPAVTHQTSNPGTKPFTAIVTEIK